YANRELYAYWSTRDPIALYSAKLQQEGIVSAADVERFKRETETLVEAEAKAIIDAPWPDPKQAGIGVFANEKPRVHVEVLDPEIRLTTINAKAAKDAKNFGFAGFADFALDVVDQPPFDPKGKTFLEGVMLGVGDA